MIEHFIIWLLGPNVGSLFIGFLFGAVLVFAMKKLLNGRLKLVRGNHDVFKLIDYIPYFDDVIACRVYPEHKLIMSHIPIHHQQLKEGWRNIHGHLHQNVVIWDGKPDRRYINVCVEHTNMRPVLLDSLL